MKNLKVLALVFALSLTSLVATGCSKKNVEDLNTPMQQTSAMTELDAAAQSISDGIIYFDYNKYDILPEYREILRQKAELMNKYPSIRVRIEGNCDERGTQEYNLALGERRARAAYDYMVMLGVNPAQLEMISYGKERPAVSGSGEEAWSLNRRDNFHVIAR